MPGGELSATRVLVRVKLKGQNASAKISQKDWFLRQSSDLFKFFRGYQTSY